mgnify:CR=1 FL=1
MARRFNPNNKKMSLDLNELKLPAGVLIGKKGSMINQMKRESGAYIKIQENRVIISGHITAVKKAREMVCNMAVNFNIGKKKTRTKKKVVVEDGWTTKGQMKTVEHAGKEEKVNTSYTGVFASLDEEDKKMKKSESWPSLVTQPFQEQEEIVWGPLTLPETVVEYAKTLPTHRPFKVMNSELAEMKNELARIEESKNWADKADIDDLEKCIEDLEEEIEAAHEIQKMIQDHPDM